MVLISIGEVEIDTESYSENVKAAVDLLLEEIRNEEADKRAKSFIISKAIDNELLLPKDDVISVKSRCLGLSISEGLASIEDNIIIAGGRELSIREALKENLIEIANDDFCVGVDIPLHIPESSFFKQKYPYDRDLGSYHPKHGCFCEFLWVDPKEIHDILCVLTGFVTTLFYRKCFMQLKRFVNLRFAR